ncbi:unnamed protein product [Strongylus vulgaris]|uniref:Uncharacterized protein n=1 Tax=Strongylus vulgaris TaxID=40348 RepID=A0A3P7JBW5_STRVU|nr:unnamed protein product [Strongylus vulgaris]
MYSPFTIEKMRFTDYGGAEKTHYQTRSGKPSKVDVGDFLLERIEAKNILLVPGSKVVESAESYPKRMVRSVFWFNLVFRRHNIFYTTRMAMPLFTISWFCSDSRVIRDSATDYLEVFYDFHHTVDAGSDRYSIEN